MKNVGQKIIELRKLYNMWQEKLAELMDVSRQTVSKWEVYSITPSSENVLALCKLFNVSSEYLLNDDLDNPEEAGTIIVHRTIPADKIIYIPDGELSQQDYENSLQYENTEIAIANQPSQKKRHKFLWLLFWILSANILVFGAIIGTILLIEHYSIGKNMGVVVTHNFSDIPLLIFVIIILFLFITAIVILIYFIIAKKNKKKAKCKQKVAEK